MRIIMGISPGTDPQQNLETKMAKAGGEWVAVQDFHPELFNRNLEALKQHHKPVFEVLQPLFAPRSLLLRRGANGYCECAEAKAGALKPILTADEAAQSARITEHKLKTLSPPPQPALTYMLGFDLGYGLRKYVKFYNQTTKKAVIIIEPDCRLFAAGLAVNVLDPVFESPRFQWVVGQPIEPQLEHIFLRKYFFIFKRIEMLFSLQRRHRELTPVWEQVKQINRVVPKKGHDELHRKMQESIQYYAQKDLTRIQKILAPNYTSGKAVPYIQNCFLRACQRMGIEVVYKKPGELQGIGLLHVIHETRPDLWLCVNRSPNELSFPDLLNRLPLPRMVWCIDDPNCFLSETLSPQDFVFTWDTSYSQDLYAKQAQAVDYFPYLADIDESRCVYDQRFAAPVSYIGQVKALNLREFDLSEDYLPFIHAAAEIKAQQPKRSYQSIVLQIQSEYGLRLIESEADELSRYLRYAIYIVGNAKRRLNVLESVRPFGLKFYGNEDWLKVLGGHPLVQCYQGPADPVDDVPRIFASSTVNLNIHSLQAQNSLNQRDFNCPLAGGFLLTDWVEGADAFFVPDEEMIFYRDPSELSRKVAYYLENEDRRRGVIERGRARVWREHTYAARAPQVLETLKMRIRERYG